MTFVAAPVSQPDAPPRRVTRVALLGAPAKPAAAELLERTHKWLAERAHVVHRDISYDARPAVDHGAEMLFVLGGDGTIISAAHSLGARQIPIVGINLGKLGYLADFNLDQLERCGSFLFAENPPVTRRVLLDVLVEGAQESFRQLAVNDCVIHAGHPYRMIELNVEVDGEEVAHIRGDGLIIATPSGSTAHNLSAGGPIIEPGASSIVMTPICAHALTIRPLVLDAGRTVVVRVPRANEGTQAAIDGQVFRPFRYGDRIVIRRFGADFLLVRNQRHSSWYSLRKKLMWGVAPGT